jgi:hypothetical protein
VDLDGLRLFRQFMGVAAACLATMTILAAGVTWGDTLFSFHGAIGQERGRFSGPFHFIADMIGQEER